MAGESGTAELWRLFGKTVRAAYSGAYGKQAVALSLAQWRAWIRASKDLPDHPPEPQTPQFQAQKMEALGRLTGGVAHDFNNLLTVVLGNAAAIRIQAEARGDTKAVQRAEVIERAAEHGGRLAGQLLAFSRKQMLRPETVSAYRVISAMHDLLAQAAGESVRVLIHAEPRLWNCLVDPGQLESAILNLVLNARDAMPVGGNIVVSCHNTKIRQALSGRSAHAPGNYVRIDVNDHGAGIPQSLQEKVFEPFFTTKPIGQGSGLGLAQVHGFTGQSGGWVELASTVGIGTTISLYLPRANGPDAEPLATADRLEAESPKASRTVQHQNHQAILVVEPDLGLRMTTCETLIRAGYHALGVANSSGAVALLASDEKIVALLTEIHLPGGISGLSLARTALQVRPNLRIVVTSGALDEARRPVQPGEKQFEFVLKPYRPADLVRIVGAVLTSDTFSIETEQLLADARQGASTAGARLATAASQRPAGVVERQGPQPASMRKNAIRLGVMPFRDIGATGDTAFSIGLAEEITTAFARFRWVTCVASASVAALVDEPPQTDRWQELDLDFLVQGSFRKHGNKIKVVLRLTNMRGSREMTWGQYFAGSLPDVLNLQDQIASETAAQMAPELLVWEAQEARSRPQVDPDAYDMMLRAIPAIYRLDEAGFREAGALLERSLALDASSAACHSWLAHRHLLSLGQGWAADAGLATEQAENLSKRAVMLDPGDARGFTVAGHVRAFLKRDAEGALALHERAIALNPNLALAWCYSGLAHCYLGQHTEAIRRIRHAKRLSPHDPHGFFFDTALAMPLLLTGQHQAAAQAGRQARDRHPGLSSTYKLLLAALGYLGVSRETSVVRKVLMALEPRFSIDAATSRSPLMRPADLDAYVKGLRLAGVPELARARGVRLDAV